MFTLFAKHCHPILIVRDFRLSNNPNGFTTTAFKNDCLPVGPVRVLPVDSGNLCRELTFELIQAEIKGHNRFFPCQEKTTLSPGIDRAGD